MAAPAPPKKIVAPTVSQINAEFVTQVRFGVCVCVCVCTEDVQAPRPGGGVFLRTGSTSQASVYEFTHVFLPSVCYVSGTVLGAGDARGALPRGVHVPGKTDAYKESYSSTSAVLGSGAMD